MTYTINNNKCNVFRKLKNRCKIQQAGFSLFFLILLLPASVYALESDEINLAINNIITEINSWYNQSVIEHNINVIGNPEMTEGGVGHAIIMNGYSDYILIKNPVIPKEIQFLTLSAWVKPNYSGADSELTLISQEGAFKLSIHNYGDDHKAEFTIFDGIRKISIESTSNISQDWNALTATYDGYAIALYVNGHLDSHKIVRKDMTYYVNGVEFAKPLSNQFTTISSSENIIIGTTAEHAKTSHYFSGILDEVQISFTPTKILPLRPNIIQNVNYTLSYEECSFAQSCSVSLNFTTRDIKDDKIQVDVQSGTININEVDYIINPETWRGTIPLKGGLLTFAGSTYGDTGIESRVLVAGKFLGNEIRGIFYDMSGSMNTPSGKISLKGSSVLSTDYVPPVKEQELVIEKSPEILLLSSHYNTAFFKGYYSIDAKVFYKDKNPFDNYYQKGGQVMGAEISVTITGPEGDILDVFQGSTDKFGYFGETMIIPENIVSGMYSVTVTASKDGATDSDELSVYIKQRPKSDTTESISVPDQVTGLTATAVSTSQINLSWNEPDDNGSPITGYQIEQKTKGTWTVIVADTGSTGTSYADTGLDADTTYWYRIRAINDIGVGDASDWVRSTTLSN